MINKLLASSLAIVALTESSSAISIKAKDDPASLEESQSISDLTSSFKAQTDTKSETKSEEPKPI